MTRASREASLNVMADGGRVAGGGGIVTGHPTSFFPRPLPDNLPNHRRGAEQSNTSIAFGNVLMLKQIRRLLSGVNPEEELTRFLTERTSFAHTPRLLGSLAYEAPSGERATLAVASELINGCEDGWSWMLAELRALTPRAGFVPTAGDAGPGGASSPGRANRSAPPGPGQRPC